MSVLNGKRRNGVSALVMAGMALGCSDDGQSTRSEREAAVLAQATPRAAAAVTATTVAARTEPVIDSTATEAKPMLISYSDAEAVYRSGRYADAAELFGMYVETRPSNAFGHYMLGLSHWKSGQSEPAVASLQHAVTLDGTHVKFRTNLARVLLEQGRAAEALTQLHAALELAPDAHEVWRVIGNVKADLGRADEALVAYREALVLQPRDAWAMNNYGLTLIRLGRFAEAVPALASAVAEAPQSALFRNNLGAALERTGDVAGARDAYTAALAADPAHERARTSLDRVSALVRDGAHAATDLVAAAQRFAAEIERWSSSSMEVVVR